jgi:hypothetical protein
VSKIVEIPPIFLREAHEFSEILTRFSRFTAHHSIPVQTKPLLAIEGPPVLKGPLIIEGPPVLKGPPIIEGPSGGKILEKRPIRLGSFASKKLRLATP